MVMSEEEIKRLYRIRKTVMEMLRDRGYLVTDNEIDMKMEDFVQKYTENMKRGDLDILKELRDKSSDKIYVFFPDSPKLGIGIIKNYLKRMKEDGVFCAILVAQQKLTPPAKTCISEVSGKLQLEVFQEAELLVNVSKHCLVPRHQLLTDVEKKTLLERYTVKETQLPRIQVMDPVARYYGMRRGQVAKIIRPSETAGLYVTYRYVV